MPNIFRVIGDLISSGITGSQSASGNLTVSSTSNATKGNILFGTSAYDEVNNRLGIGTASPSQQFVSEVESDTLTAALFTVQYAGASNSAAGGFTGQKARGTKAAPTAVQSGDAIAGFFASGYHSGGSFGSNTVAIRFSANENFTSTAQGTRIEFFTTPNGSNTRVERLRVFDSGNVAINTFTDAGFRLDVNGTARFQGRVTVSQDTTVATQTVAVITTDTTNAGLVLRPNGTGAIMAQAPDGTATGGNARGGRAVDLQMERVLGTAAAQVASGTNSVIGGGKANQASGSQSTISGGEFNLTEGTYSSIPGGASARAYLYAQTAIGSGEFALQSDAQTSTIRLRRSITGQSATELTLSGAAPAAGTRAILNISSPGPTNARAWRAQVDVVAIVQTVGNGTVTLGDCFMGSYHVGIKRIGTATSLVGAVSVTNEVNDAGMAGAAVTITADDATENLKIEFTPATNAGSTTVTRVVATAYLTEVGY